MDPKQKMAASRPWILLVQLALATIGSQAFYICPAGWFGPPSSTTRADFIQKMRPGRRLACCEQLHETPEGFRAHVRSMRHNGVICAPYVTIQLIMLELCRFHYPINLSATSKILWHKREGMRKVRIVEFKAGNASSNADIAS